MVTWQTKNTLCSQQFCCMQHKNKNYCVLDLCLFCYIIHINKRKLKSKIFSKKFFWSSFIYKNTKYINTYIYWQNTKLYPLKSTAAKSHCNRSSLTNIQFFDAGSFFFWKNSSHRVLYMKKKIYIQSVMAYPCFVKDLCYILLQCYQQQYYRY